MVPMSTEEILATYADIELTQEETNLALLEAKRKKQFILQQQARSEREAATRRLLMAPVWPREQPKGFMLMQIEKNFKINSTSTGTTNHCSTRFANIFRVNQNLFRMR